MMRIIYNDGDINNDVIGLLQYINEFTNNIGVIVCLRKWETF